MMERNDEKDREIERLFEAAREADREAAPAFRQIVAQGRLDRHRHERPRVHRSRLLWLGATGTVAVAAFAAWLGTQAPPPPVPESITLRLVKPTAPEVEPAATPALQKAQTSSSPDPAGVPEPAPSATGTRGPLALPPAPLPGDKVERVKVEAQAPVVDVASSSVATELSDEFIESLPVAGRLHQGALTPAPGVQDSNGGGSPAKVHGSRERDFKAVVTGQRMVAVNPNQIEDMETITGGVGIEAPLLAGVGDVQSPVLINRVQPEYPEIARTARMEGRVILQAIVNEHGTVDDVEVLRSSNAVFDRDAIEAVRQWRYKPAMQDGKPVSVYFTTVVEFNTSDVNTEAYDPIEENPFLDAVENPLSTFSIDVDTASYANVRRFLNQGRLPPRDAVRIEEMVNYFRYDYPGPAGRDPFGASIEIAACPWSPDHRLARIGLKGREIDRGRREPSNLVFLIDVSGSMNDPSKLPLVQRSLGLLADELDDRDRVAIVVYAGASGLVLPSTPGSSRGEIRSAIGRLSAGGSTNGGAGLELAYATARENFVRGGTNRVILATDGDFNVGVTSQAELLSLIESDAKRGIFLTALGFGMGNYKDTTLEMLADKGNGNYAYIDDLREARKVLVEELTGTLVTIAKDVKIQVEFNPAEVGAYRLIGYENRMLRKEDFNDDRKDAGEIGAGHTVTALYEIVPASGRRDVEVPSVDPLRYQKGPALSEAARRGELFTLKLRYKEPEGESSRLLEFPALDTGARRGSADFEFAAAVAGFGMLLRDSGHAGDFTFRDVRDLARGAAGRGADREYRDELVRLVDRAAAID